MDNNKVNRNAVIYCRSATKNRANMFGSLQMQEEMCRTFAVERGYDVTEVFSDEGFSGADSDRPGLQKMLGFIEANAGAFVLIADIDVLARNAVCYHKLRERIRDAGWRCDSPNVNLDDSPESRFAESVLAARAQHEAEWEAGESDVEGT